MSMTKTKMVVAALCLVATSVSAQLPTVNVSATQKVMPSNVSIEQLKENLKSVKMQSPVMKMNKVNASTQAMKPMTGIISAPKQMMTRAGSFEAKYDIPAGIYNIKSGFEYLQGQYSRHGILAPIFEDVVYKNSSSFAAYIDWYINNTLVMGMDSISVTYIPDPTGESFYSVMPELTAYAATGDEQVFQYGYALDRETGKFTEGQAVNTSFGYIHNLDAGAETYYDTYMMTMSGDWSQMLFGYNVDMKADFFEIFEKPLSPIFLNSFFTYVATPIGQDISTKEFSLYVMSYNEEANAWSIVTETFKTKPVMIGTMEENDLWGMEIYFDRPIMMKDQFALVLGGPQDGTAWAFFTQYNRELTSGKVTAGYIPLEGQYQGYLSPYAAQLDNGDVVAYPFSLDLGLQVFMPYNMAIDPSTGDFVNYGGYTEIPSSEGFYATVYLWNWEAYIMGSKASMNITSDSDWLTAEITRAAADNNFLYEINIYVNDLPEGVAGRRGTLTFTDGMGYQSTWTFVQGDKAAGIDGVTISQDSNAPIYDLTGRQVSVPAKGIYIQNGKKFVVK